MPKSFIIYLHHKTGGVDTVGSNLLVDVYTAPIPEGEIGLVLCPLRRAQIHETKSQKQKHQRYYVWKLLEYAAKNSFGLNAETLNFSKDNNGKWSCSSFYFSLSHSGDAVAVAVSTKPVGVDLECTERTVSQNLAGTILTPAEQHQFSAISQELQQRYLLEKWCAKESLFKAGNSPAFHPRKLETASGVWVQHLGIGNHTYCCAVAAENISQIRLFQNIII